MSPPEGVTEGMLAAMELLFVQEFPSEAPIRLPRKVGRDLVRAGLAEAVELSIPGNPLSRSPLDRMPLRVVGHRLTPRGHLIYCEWAAQQPDERDGARRATAHLLEARP